MLNVNQLTQTAFSQMVGVGQSYISEIIRGKKQISATVILFIANSSLFENINIRWLLSGKGEMYNYPNYYAPPELDSGQANKLQEGVRIEYGKPESPDDLRRMLEQLERRMRTIEGKLKDG